MAVIVVNRELVLLMIVNFRSLKEDELISSTVLHSDL